MSTVESDQRTSDPDDRSDGALSKESKSALLLRVQEQQRRHDSLKEELAESKARNEKLSEELKAKDTMIAEMTVALAERDKLLHQLKGRLSDVADGAPDDVPDGDQAQEAVRLAGTRCQCEICYSCVYNL